MLTHTPYDRSMDERAITEGLRCALNAAGGDAALGIPDFVLADFLVEALKLLDAHTRGRGVIQPDRFFDLANAALLRARGYSHGNPSGPVPLSRIRVTRQRVVYDWIRRVFGDQNAGRQERAMRLFEEATELAQVESIQADALCRLVRYVYDKPRGQAKQEVGGVGVTLLAYCEAALINADEQEAIELERVLELDDEHFVKRHNAKAAAGVAKATAPGKP